MTRSLVVVSAGLSQPSSTRMLADRLSASATRALEWAGETVEVTTVELRPLAHALADWMLTGFASGELADQLRAVSTADALIVTTPVFTASYSGLFKSFVDALDPDSLVGTPVLISATAGTARHSLVLDHQLRPLFAYLRALVLPTGVFAASEDFGSTEAGALADRVDRAAAELAAAVAALPSAPARLRSVPDPTAEPSAEPLADWGGPVDELPEPVPFEELLHRQR